MSIDHQLLIVAALAAGVGALVTHLLVPLVAKTAVVFEALDYPGHRKTHAEPIPRLGGVAIVIGLLFGAATVLVPMWSRWRDFLEVRGFFALALGTALVFLTGLVDDLTGLSVFKKLVMECLAASLLVAGGWHFEKLAIPGTVLELGVWGPLLTVVWLVGVTNAINLIDGLDGLASGVVAIIGFSFLTFTLFQDSPLAVALVAAMVGGCLGFLPHNRQPAQIFMGDAGALTLGFLLASLSVFTTLKSPAAVAVLVPLLALGVPLIDTGLVIEVRQPYLRNRRDGSRQPVRHFLRPPFHDPNVSAQ